MIQQRYVWTQILFKYGGKHLQFRKYPATCGEAFYCCVVMLCDGVGKLTFLLFNVHFSGLQIIMYFSRRHKLQRLVALL